MQRHRAAIERRGASLVSTVAALGLTAVCLTLVVHAAVQGQRFAVRQQARALAFATCQRQAEALRADGYARLPALGAHGFAVATLPGARGETVVAAGSVPGTKTVTVRVAWPSAGERSAGQVELSLVLAARGLSP
ncbi:MAG: hypothetical protein KKI08_08920 [Armatimonadetes bacterium]|nr:hypothetical protein [Armatimonadota bacterium]